MKALRRVCLVFLGLGVVTLAAEPAPPAEAPPPLRLTIGINDIYGKATACECVHQVAAREYGDFLDLLSRRDGIALELVYFSEPYQLERALREGRFDGVICKPWLAIRAGAKGERRLKRIADLQAPTGNAQLWGEFVVLRDSKIRTLRDLSGRRLALGQTDAYEKHHAALALLARDAVEIPEARRVEKASCLECLDLLLKREVDAAVISSYALTADCPADIVKPGEVRAIATTAKMPLTSLLIDERRVSKENAARLARAVIERSRTALPASMHGGGFVAAQRWEPAEMATLTP